MIKLNRKSIVITEMKAVWFPTDWQQIIVKRAKKAKMPIYKYLMLSSQNYEKKV